MWQTEHPCSLCCLQVAFDPLDGSSIVGANFAVGSIFGIWPGDELIGRRGSEQAAAVYAVYGPRTVLVVAWPHQGEGQMQGLVHSCSGVTFNTTAVHLPYMVHLPHVAPTHSVCVVNMSITLPSYMHCPQADVSIHASMTGTHACCTASRSCLGILGQEHLGQ